MIGINALFLGLFLNLFGGKDTFSGSLEIKKVSEIPLSIPFILSMNSQGTHAVGVSAYGAQADTLSVWDLVKQTLKLSIPLYPKSKILLKGNVLFTPDGSQIYAYYDEIEPEELRNAQGRIMWNRETGQEERLPIVLPKKSFNPFDVNISWHSQDLALILAHKNLSHNPIWYVWELHNGQSRIRKLATQSKERAFWASSTFNPEGTQCIVSNTMEAPGVYSIYDVQTLSLVKTIPAFAQQVGRLLWAPDGKKIIGVTFDHAALDGTKEQKLNLGDPSQSTICVWNLEGEDCSLKTYQPFKGDTYIRLIVGISPDSQYLIAGLGDYFNSSLFSPQVLDLETGGWIKDLCSHASFASGAVTEAVSSSIAMSGFQADGSFTMGFGTCLQDSHDEENSKLSDYAILMRDKMTSLLMTRFEKKVEKRNELALKERTADFTTTFYKISRIGDGWIVLSDDLD